MTRKTKRVSVPSHRTSSEPCTVRVHLTMSWLNGSRYRPGFTFLFVYNCIDTTSWGRDTMSRSFVWLYLSVTTISFYEPVTMVRIRWRRTRRHASCIRCARHGHSEQYSLNKSFSTIRKITNYATGDKESMLCTILTLFAINVQSGSGFVIQPSSGKFYAKIIRKEFGITFFYPVLDFRER